MACGGCRKRAEERKKRLLAEQKKREQEMRIQSIQHKISTNPTPKKRK